jgi:hypothetical protein
LQATANGGALTIKVEGNDFRANLIGVNILAGGGGPVTGIDLGGGPQNSLGANNFRSFTTSATATSGAAVTTAANANGPIDAHMNLYGVSDPNQVDFDANYNPGLADVVELGQLTANSAYVEELYNKFLNRTGDLNSSTDAGGWVNQLNAGASPATVANFIMRSPEALAIQVNNLFRQFLNRNADSAGQAAFGAYLRAGGTLEGVTIAILSSPEYRHLFGSDVAFVQSLYNNLLGRVGSTSEVSGWVAQIPGIGRSGVVQAFVTSAEYRSRVVRMYYSLLFNRPNPSSSEVSFWVNSGKDLLSIEIAFASTSEFQTQG